MTETLKCQSCGYKVKKDSNRTVRVVDITVIMFDSIITRQMTLCSMCEKNLLYIVNGLLTNFSIDIE